MLQTLFPYIHVEIGCTTDITELGALLQSTGGVLCMSQ
jgi:hypothetical protein